MRFITIKSAIGVTIKKITGGELSARDIVLNTKCLGHALEPSRQAVEGCISIFCFLFNSTRAGVSEEGKAVATTFRFKGFG